MASSNSIDLAKEKPNLVDQVIKWALGFGRLLIIVVEIIAFSAFIYRFTLDRDLSDLNDTIKGEQAIITSSADQEAEYRDLHERFATVNKVNITGNTKITLLNDIVSFTPEEISFDTFVSEEDELSITVEVTSIPALTGFLKSLQDYPEITTVAITGIDNTSGTNSVTVDIEAKLKGGVK